MPEPGQDGAGEIAASAYYSNHDLREMFSRDNATRRRENGHTFRKYLTAAQDKGLVNAFTKIRDEFAVTNNNDVVLVWAKLQIEDGKEEELDARLAELAKAADIPKRDAPWDDEKGQ